MQIRKNIPTRWSIWVHVVTTLGDTYLICWPTGSTDPILTKTKKQYYIAYYSTSLFYYFLFLDKTYNNQNQKEFIICQKQPLEVFRKKRCS